MKIASHGYPMVILPWPWIDLQNANITDRLSLNNSGQKRVLDLLPRIVSEQHRWSCLQLCPGKGASREKPGNRESGWLAVTPGSATARSAKDSSAVSSAQISNFKVEAARSHPFLYKNSKSKTNFRCATVISAKRGSSPPTAPAAPAVKQTCSHAARPPQKLPRPGGDTGEAPKQGAPKQWESQENPALPWSQAILTRRPYVKLCALPQSCPVPSSSKWWTGLLLQYYSPSSTLKTTNKTWI